MGTVIGDGRRVRVDVADCGSEVAGIVRYLI